MYLVLGGLGLTPLQQNVLDGGRPGLQRRIGEAERRRGTAAAAVAAAGRFGGGRRARRAISVRARARETARCIMSISIWILMGVGGRGASIHIVTGERSGGYAIGVET